MNIVNWRPIKFPWWWWWWWWFKPLQPNYGTTKL